MLSSHPLPAPCQWFARLASALDRRSAPRLALLFLGAVLARGRRTVTSWIRAAGLSDHFQHCYTAVAAAGKKAERHAVAVLTGCKAVDDFIERTVATAGDHEAATFGGGAPRHFGGMARAGGFCKFGFDAAGGKNMASCIERAPSSAAAVAGVRVVNQQSVSEISGHHWSRHGPFVPQDTHSI